MAGVLERMEVLLVAAVGDAEDDVLAAAREQARALLRAGDASADAAERAALALAGEGLGLVLLERRFAETASAVVDLLVTGSPRGDAAVRLDLFRELLSSRALGELPPAAAAEGVLRAAVSIGPLSEASLWESGERRLACLSLVGENAATRRMRACAHEVLRRGRSRNPGRGHVHGVPVLRWGATYAALVFRARPAAREAALAYAREAASHLTTVVDRERLLRRAGAHERTLVEASERRLVRIGLDIHDGPLQVLATLVGDTHVLRDRLESGRDLGGDLRFLRAWLDDYALRLREVDEALRELALSLESRRLRAGDLAVALRDEASTFAARSGIDVEIDVSGSFDKLTPSQRFALAGVVREGLANVREHSSAARATLRVRATAACIRASIVDDGRGFDVERALVAAAERGRLGLVGMSERVRLLGGHLAVDSRPGGPTAITVTLPRWEAVSEAAVAPAAAAPAGR